MHKVLSKAEAQELNSVWYYTGVPCQNNHVDKRYTNTGICYACKRRRNNDDYGNHRGKRKKIAKRSYEKNKANQISSSRRWAANNKEKVRIIKNRNAEKHAAKYRKREAERVKRKRQSDPFFRLSRNISKEMWAVLKDKKQGKTWRTFVNDDIFAIKNHLESQFTVNMTWENYGTYWEVDHITPLSWFSHLDPYEAVRLAWSVSNLQPLECSFNRSKQDRYNLKKEEIYELYRRCP